ncbi:hypothetical protein [Tabrizicola aquatica]|uniref:hypothetical protein n=1 Tax=Tabrizicola aquatica TaxID=909926 RepID=UPI0011AF8BF8|nr:hypothetical protein [Tabrizicola aquatica]
MTRRLSLALASALFLAAGALLLWLAADAFAAAQTREREYRYLTEALDPVEIPAAAVTWGPPLRPLVRDFAPTDKHLVGTALTQAWRAFAAASDTGETRVLADHFSGQALQRATLAAAQAWQDGTRMVVLETSARPTFLHLDGSLLQVEGEALSVRYALRDGALHRVEVTRDAVRTTLTNETTGWRIFGHELTASAPLPAVARTDRAVPRLFGVNYYPARTPWRRFWPEFDAAIVAADLDLVRSLGGNSVRIFLPTAAFGPDAGGQKNLDRLKLFLDLAEERQLAVVPTLFDLKPGYRPALWAEDLAYLRRVLPVLAGHPAVALVDLKNEPDLDREAHLPGQVDAWLATMIHLSRSIAPDLPLTIGWASASAAQAFAAELDAITYHDYAPVEGTAERLATVRAAAQGKPVLVTEIGASSYTFALGVPGSPTAQAGLLADRLTHLQGADGALVWTLHDFENPDPGAFGASPWTLRLQGRYGLFDPMGTRKPAAQAVEKAFAAARAATPAAGYTDPP